MTVHGCEPWDRAMHDYSVAKAICAATWKAMQRPMGDHSDGCAVNRLPMGLGAQCICGYDEQQSIVR